MKKRRVYVESGRIRQSPCPSCGKLQDAFTALSEERNARPEAGAVVICGYCASVNV